MKNIFKKSWLMLSMIALVSLTTGCSMQRVPAGYVGIKVNTFGSDKGVAIETLGTGQHFCNFCEFKLFPTFMQNVVWTASKTEGRNEQDESITFQTKEGLGINADVSFSYQLEASKISAIFQKYRQGVDEITHVYLRSIVRDSFNAEASQRNAEAIYGSQKAEFLSAVLKRVKARIEPEGFIVNQLSVVNTMRLPGSMQESINNKVNAIQQAEQRENELREVQAKAKKDIATAEANAKQITLKAQAEAEANRMQAVQITPQVLELKKLEIQLELAKKWNGALPVISSSGGGNMLIDTAALLAKK